VRMVRVKRRDRGVSRSRKRKRVVRVFLCLCFGVGVGGGDCVLDFLCGEGGGRHCGARIVLLILVLVWLLWSWSARSSR